VDAGLQRDLQYLSLRTAAAVTYIRLVGAPPDASNTFRLQRTLNHMARALAALAPIHSYDAVSANMREIDDAGMQGTRLVRGAAALAMPDGTETSNLVIQRRDLDAAVAILKQSDLAAALRAAHARP
jgi:hypothetical protein